MLKRSLPLVNLDGNVIKYLRHRKIWCLKNLDRLCRKSSKQSQWFKRNFNRLISAMDKRTGVRTLYSDLISLLLYLLLWLYKLFINHLRNNQILVILLLIIDLKVASSANDFKENYLQYFIGTNPVNYTWLLKTHDRLRVCKQ